jgi:predicted metallopeptidase
MIKIGIDADLVILVTNNRNGSSNTLAWAGSCILDESYNANFRPVFSQINFNVAKFKFNSEYFERQVDVAIHELTHALAFSTGLFPFYYNANTKQTVGVQNIVENILVDGQEVPHIITHNVFLF